MYTLYVCAQLNANVIIKVFHKCFKRMFRDKSNRMIQSETGAGRAARKGF